MALKSFDGIPLVRSNYFPGLYVLETDLEEQRHYLGARQQYHRQCLYVSGVIEGLEITPVPGQMQVNIGAGTAVDRQGHLIVLQKEELNFDVGIQGIKEGDLYIQWQENDPTSEPPIHEDDPFTRPHWSEEPTILFENSTPPGAITLAKLSLSDGAVKLDFSTRQSSGLKLPSPGGKLFLGYQGSFQEADQGQSETAVLEGNFNVAGDLSVTGSATIADLHIARNQNFRIDLQGTAQESSEGQVNDVWVNGSSVLTDALRQRGLNTVILQPDGTVRDSQHYDVHAAPDSWNLWASWIIDTALDGDAVAVTSHDALGSVPINGVAEALLQSVGATQVLALESIQATFNRIPYALLFIKGQQYSAKEVLMPYQGGNAKIAAQYREMASNVDFIGAISAKHIAGTSFAVTGSSTFVGPITVQPILTAIAHDEVLTAIRIKPTFVADPTTLTEIKQNALIVEGGNVGIGTTTPDAQLEVNGSLKASDVTITGSLTIGRDIHEIDVATTLMSKANTTDVNSALALKANTVDVNNALALKANLVDVDRALESKADAVSVNHTLADKASLGGSSEQDFMAKKLTVQSLDINGVDIATTLHDKAEKNGSTVEDFNTRNLTIAGSLAVGDRNSANISVAYYREGYKCCLGPVIPDDSQMREQWAKDLWEQTVQSWGGWGSNRPQSTRDAGIIHDDFIDAAEYLTHKLQGWSLMVYWRLSYRRQEESWRTTHKVDVWILHPAEQLPSNTRCGWSIVHPDGTIAPDW